MQLYILRRLLLLIPTLFVVSVVIFSLLRVIPGDVVMARVAESSYVTPEAMAEMRHELGLDRNPIAQYGTWSLALISGDFGNSLWTGRPILRSLLRVTVVSLELAFMAWIIGMVIALPLGVLAAVKQDSWIDYFARFFAVLGLATPSFWIATMLLLFLSVQLRWLPEFGWYEPWEEPWKNFQAMIFPAMIMGVSLAGTTARMTRSTLLEVLRQDYIRTARAKGLQERDILLKHAMRNGLIPVVTILGSQLGFLLGGTVILETIFSLPGLGRFTYEAVLERDYPVIQGAVMFFALKFIILNLVIDLSYGVIDPRIRYS